MNAFSIFFFIVRVVGFQRFVVRKNIAEKPLTRLLLLLILKRSKFHRKARVLESVFNKFAGLQAQLKKTFQHRYFSQDFFLSGFSFTNIHDPQGSRGRGRVSV